MISVNLLIVSSWEAGDSALQIDRKHIGTARTKLPGIFVQFQPKIKEFLACCKATLRLGSPSISHLSPTQSRFLGAPPRGSEVFEYFVASPYDSVYTFFCC